MTAPAKWYNGRPPLPRHYSGRHTRAVTARVTEEQHADIVAGARMCGVSVSTFCRLRILSVQVPREGDDA